MCVCVREHAEVPQLSAVDKKKSDNYICEKATTMIAAKRDNKKL